MHGDNKYVPLKIKAEFSFFAVTAFLLCTGEARYAFLCLAACMLHELGHLIVMYAERRPPESITLYGGGIKISGGSHSVFSLAGGCLMNILLFAVFF